MEEFIQILIFAGAMIASVVIQSAKNKKKSGTTSPKEVLEEVFPEIEEIQEEMPADSQPIKQPVANFKRKSFKANKKEEPVKPVVPPSEPMRKKDRNIRLSNREEARRAFIYSEIFNRKY